MKNYLLILAALVTFTSCQRQGEIEELAVENNKQIFTMSSGLLNDYGWDEGVSCYSGSDDDFYVVMHEVVDEEEHDMVTVCINGLGKSSFEDAMLMHFCDGELQDIYLSGLLFVVESCTDTGIMSFVAYNGNGEYIDEYDVPYEIMYRAETNPSMSKSPFFNSKGAFSWPKTQEFLKKVSPTFKKLGIVVPAIYHGSEGKFGDIVLDLLTGAVVGAVAGAGTPLLLTLVTEELAKMLVKNIYDCIVSSYLGHAQIEIESIKRTSSTTITVNGTISDALSIPNYIHTSSGQEENFVFWGIAEGKSGQPGFYVNEHCSDLELISNNSFSYTFYAETNPGLVHYFRPFLIPKAKTPSEANPASRIVSCIRYGERKEYLDMSVDLENFQQNDCKPVNENSYKAHFTIDGSIPGTFSELSNWGIDVAIKSASYSQRFYAKEPSEYYPPTENSFICEIPFDESDIVDYASERVVEITITPWISFWNQLPAILFFDPRDYCITISDFGCPDDNHPHAIDLGLSVKWACCNVGASNPEDDGDYFAWGETSPKSEYSRENYKYFYKDENLYYAWWWQIIKYNTESVYGTVDNKTTLDSSDDAAHVNWGGSWRMPTKAEQEELKSNCIWTWDRQNGVEFYKVRSKKNGNSIILPTKGANSGGTWNDDGSHRHYWSSSLSSGFVHEAYGITFHYGYIYCWSHDRDIGLFVRPVTE